MPHVMLIKPLGAALSGFPPINLMYLAAYLRARGYTSRVLDMGFARDGAYLRALPDSDRPVLFGVSATTPEFPEAIRLVLGLKKRFPRVPVVIGGVHVSALGVDAVSEAGADFGVCGEGEQTLAELVTALQEDGPGADLSGILGLIHRNGEEFIVNEARRVMQDVDALPVPAWDLVHPERYFARPWGIVQIRKRTGFILTSRGCQHACSFCASRCTMGSTFRGRAPGLVVDEIEDLYRRHGVREILVAEENFTADPKRAAAICEEIMRRGLDIAWRTPNGVRADSLDPSLVELMSRSGCYLLGFGTGATGRDPGDSARKKQAWDRVTDTIALIRRHGMMTFGSFILGLPGETRSTMQETIRYAARSDLDIGHFGLYAPYPGSGDFEKMKGMPGLREWRRYLLSEALPCCPLPPGQMKALLRRAYFSFYLRPARIRLYRRLLRPAQLREATRALYIYLK